MAAIKGGVGFVGIHSASDTWHTVVENLQGKDARYLVMGDKLDSLSQNVGRGILSRTTSIRPGTFTIVEQQVSQALKYAGPKVTQEMGEVVMRS